MTNIVSCEIAEESWICPICNEAPTGSNFRILMRDQTPGVSVREWLCDPEKLQWKVSDRSGPVEHVENLLGHEVVFCGCSKCFSAKISGDPIARVLFKSMWVATGKILRAQGRGMRLNHRQRIDIYL